MEKSTYEKHSDPKSLKEVGKRIRLIRTMKKLTQAQLAEKLHVTIQAVSGWERGQNSVNTYILPELAKILDVTIDYLLCGKGRFDLSAETADQAEAIPKMPLFSLLNEQEYDAYRKNIRERIQGAPKDIERQVESAFETDKPLYDIFRLALCSYCSRQWLEPDRFPFSHVLAILPFLKSQTEIDVFAGMLDLDPDIYMMYALAPYVSQGLLGYWAGLCDFRKDAAFAGRLLPLLSDEDRLLYMERAVYEMPSQDIAKHFSDYLTPEAVARMLTCPEAINAALSLYGHLDTEQIRGLIMRCSPEEIPELAYCIPQNVPDDIVHLLVSCCPKEKMARLQDLMFGLEADLEKE